MLIAMAPLVVLYELSILLASVLGRPVASQEIVDDPGDDLLS
jgi:Sec-independent protein secretion pathway component TatC